MSDAFYDDPDEPPCPKCHGEAELMIAPEGFQVFEDDVVICPVCSGEGTVPRGSVESEERNNG